MSRTVRLIVLAGVLVAIFGAAACTKDDGSAAKMDELQKANAALEERVVKLERELEAVSSRVNRTEVQTQQIRERLADAEGVVDKMTSRMDRVESR